MSFKTVCKKCKCDFWNLGQEGITKPDDLCTDCEEQEKKKPKEPTAQLPLGYEGCA